MRETTAVRVACQESSETVGGYRCVVAIRHESGGCLIDGFPNPGLDITVAL